MVWTDIRFPNRRIICIGRRGAEMKRFILTIRSSWWSSLGVEIFIKPLRFLWCGRPVSRLRRKILLMHPWDTPSILTPPRWELPSADNLTIRCSICCGKFCGMIPFKSSKKYQYLYRNRTLHKSIKVVMARQTSLQVTTPELTFFLLLSLSDPLTILTMFGHSIWLSKESMKSTVFRPAIEHTTRHNKYQSNSRKCHLVAVIPYRWSLVLMNYTCGIAKVLFSLINKPWLFYPTLWGNL